MSLAERLQNLLSQHQMTEADLGKHAGISQQAINKIVNGETKKPRHLVAIAAALQVDPIWLLTGIGSMQAVSAPHHKEPPIELKDIPIYQLKASPTDNHDSLHLNNQQIIGQIKRPIKMAQRHGLYAIYMPNNSMEPRFMLGDLLIIDGFQPPQIGDDCVIVQNQSDDNESQVFIKQFRYIENSLIHALQYHPQSSFEIKVDNVSLQRILTIKDFI
ncbi:MAG: XRE family transcriptional regulator [Alphaproteobacteria bacterium]